MNSEGLGSLPMISLTISQRIDGVWVPVDLSRYRDPESLAIGLLAMDGTVTVAKWTNSGVSAMVCGSAKQAGVYQGKGERVITFPALVSGLRSKDYLEALTSAWSNPVVTKAQEIFDGAQITEQDLLQSREERVAIMTEGGDVTEEEAQSFCDKRPDLYGPKKEK